MPTSCNTHDYDGKLREKWFEMRPMLIEKYLSNCLSFDDTIQQIEEWLEKKYFNVKRIGRARRSIRILRTQRRTNFDSRNEINVEELLPILWQQVKNQEDIHDTFYEQLCDITGGSCSQGRSTRLFQFLFLFDLPNQNQSQNTDTSNQQEQSQNNENQPVQVTTDEQHQQQQLKPSQEEKPENQEHTEDKHLVQKEQEPQSTESTNSSNIQTE